MIQSRNIVPGTLLLLACLSNWAQSPQPDGGGVRPGELPKSWRTGGPTCGDAPEWEVHAYNPDLYILRENGCVNYEKPFLFLYFGSEKALLIDTGAAGETQIATAVSGVIDEWATRNHRDPPPLIVGHSHSHDDHTAGDAQLRARPNTTVIPLTREATMKMFDIPSWPDGFGKIDLGGRVIDVFPIPGHDVLSLAYYDRQTGILHAGDSLYPGRLYVKDFPAFVASTQRMVTFTEGKIVTHIVGCHIEQSRTPYLDYKVGTKYQPDEHSLDMGRGELLELNDALSHMKTPVRMAFRDFTIWPT
jgi:glyoxylase-like metal-dependent hydrolase (beta-lactamase superfamily II)